MFRRAPVLAAATSALAKQIQELRYKTDAPLLQCKKALAECDGNMDKAIEWLRAKGAADSVKKEGRETAFGTLAACIPKAGSGVTALAKPAGIIEVGAETDFAVRNEKFTAFLSHLSTDFATVIGDAEHGSRSNEELGEMLVKRGEDAKKTLIAALGENVTIKRVWMLPTPEAGMPPRYAGDVTAPAAFSVGSYVHNSTVATPLVGNIIGFAGVWSYKAGDAGVVSASDCDDFAQHLVSHLGDVSDIAGQSFLGGDLTVSKWCKAHVARLRTGMVFKYGMDTPQLIVPKPVEAGPKA